VTNEDQERQEREANQALRLAAVARDAIRNEAVQAYFDEIEAKAIDAMIAAAPTEDLERLRCAVVAGTIRGMRRFLEDAVAGGDYAAELLKQLNKGVKAR
jgi:hypothetical protein